VEKAPCRKTSLKSSFDDNLDDYLIAKYSALPIMTVAALRGQIKADNSPKEKSALCEHVDNALRKMAELYINDGLENGLVSKYAIMSISEVLEIRAEMKASASPEA
jgi:hypothetical protein